MCRWLVSFGIVVCCRRLVFHIAHIMATTSSSSSSSSLTRTASPAPKLPFERILIQIPEGKLVEPPGGKPYVVRYLRSSSPTHTQEFTNGSRILCR